MMSLSELYSENTELIETNLRSITELSLYGQWCATQDEWGSTSTIKYDSMFHTNTNMDVSGSVLNTGTGKKIIFVIFI